MSKVVKVLTSPLSLISSKAGKIASGAFMIAAGVVTGNPGLILAGVGRVASAFAKTPKSPLGNIDRLNASINPGAYRTMWLGSTAGGTDIRYVEPSGTDQEYIDYIVGCACHRIDGFDEIWFEDRKAWTSAGGVDSYYSGYLWIDVREEGTSANTIAINGGSRWGSDARLTGCAYVHIRLKRTGNGKKAESPLVNGLPSRLTIIGRGMPLYDPRQDSTVPGGSGSMRASDQATWAFSGIGDNAALQILGRLIGWRINGLLSVGDGVPLARINMAGFITAANLCDEAVTKADASTEPRYQAAVVVTEGDQPSQAYAALLAACNARFRDSGGQLSLAIMHNDLAVIATDDGLTDDDVLGGFTWDPHPSLPDSDNIVRGKYTDASTNGLYQQVDYPEVKIASIDGRDRVLPLDLIAVESPSQAQRIVKQVLERRQYAGRFSAVFSNRAWKYQVGDPLPFTFSACAFDRSPFRVAEQQIAYDGTCPMVLTVEHEAIYAWDASETPAVEPAAPEKFDPRNSPYILGIGEAGATADWDGVDSKPVELTDGRVAAGLDHDGNVEAGKVLTPSLGANTVTDSIQAYNGALVTGSNAFVEVISFDIEMEFAGDIYVWLSGKQGYSTGTPSWQAKLLIDGTEIFYTGGGSPSDSISLSGKLSVSSGTHTVTFEWLGSTSGISIDAFAASMIAFRAYK